MHGPSSAGERRGCRSQCAGLARGGPHACVVRLATQPSMHVLVPCPATPTLTDAANFLYYCLPNHRSALAKGVGGDPPFQGDPGLKLE